MINAVEDVRTPVCTRACMLSTFWWPTGTDYPGSYIQSCRGCSYDATTLSCNFCKRRDQSKNYQASIDIEGCPGNVSNCNGESFRRDNALCYCILHARALPNVKADKWLELWNLSITAQWNLQHTRSHWISIVSINLDFLHPDFLHLI